MCVNLPTTCNAVVLEKFNVPMKVKTVKVPDKIEPRGILVQVEVASICGTDVHLYEGDLGVLNIKLPVIPGHEMVGKIVAFGQGVKCDSAGQELKIGDRILWEHSSCGQCYYCKVLKNPTLCRNRKYYMAENCEEYPYLVGGFAEYCYVFPNSGRIKIPDEVKSDWASSVCCALRTVMNGFDRLNSVGDIQFTDTVLIQGAGALGLYATAVASAKNPKEIIVIGGPANRLEVAKSWGATRTISVAEYPDPKSRAERVLEFTGGKGADVCIEVSGAHGAVAEGLEMIGLGGKYVIIGQVGGPRTSIAAEMITKKNLDIVGTWSAGIEHYYKGLQFVKQNPKNVNFDLMFSNRYAFKDINTAIEKMKNFEVIKPLLMPR